MLLLTLGLLACGPKTPPVPPPAPDPLAERPAVGPAVAFTPPAPTQLELANGARLWVVPQPGLPLVSVRVVVPGGSATDPDAQPGLATLADEMLLHGAGDRDSSAFAEATERLALDLWVSTGARNTTLSLDAHADRLDEGLGLLADAVMRPTFAPDELDLVRDQQIGSIKEALDDAGAVAATVALAAWYGPGHPLAHPTQGTEAGIAALTPADLSASWSARAVPARSTFVVAGAVEPAALKETLDRHFGAWSAPDAPEPVVIPAPMGIPTDGIQRIFVDVPGSSQTTLRLHLPGWPIGDAAEVPGSLGVIALGGTFTSRLNRLLREEKGYTYGARARHSASPDSGTVVVSTAVQQEVTAPALADLLAEVGRLSDGVRPDEVTKAAGARRTGLIEAMASRGAIAGTFAGLVADGRGPDALPTLLGALDAASVESIGATLDRPSLEHAVLVVAGDLASIEADVRAAVPGEWSTAEPLR